jgi:hypothetical protein
VLPLVPGDKGARLLGPVPARTTRKKTSDPCSPLAPLSVRTPDSAFCFLSFFCLDYMFLRIGNFLKQAKLFSSYRGGCKIFSEG